jgi:exodeoxyribonuclease-1
MTIDRLTDASLPCHYDMVRQLRDRLTAWSPAVFIGYNSLRFDEELLRKALFRTLHSPYLTNTGGNCRADAMALVQAASVFAPTCLNVPIGDKGKPLFKLDRLAPSNGFSHENAHDALADVLATIHLARCVRDRAPEVWSRFLRFATKAAVASFLDEEEAVVLTEFYFNKPYHFVVSPFGADPSNPAAILTLDLKHDVDWLASLPHEHLTTLLGRSPKPVRRVRTNAAPNLAAVDEVEPHILGPLDPQTISERAVKLRQNAALQARLIEAFAAATPAYEDSDLVEEQLYSGGFVTAADQALMDRFHAVPWPDRASIVGQMQDPRLRYHGMRLIHELHPDVLSVEQRDEIEGAMWDRLLLERGPKGKWTSLPDALEQTEKMLGECDEAGIVILGGLREHLKQRLAQGRARQPA